MAIKEIILRNKKTGETEVIYCRYDKAKNKLVNYNLTIWEIVETHVYIEKEED